MQALIKTLLRDRDEASLVAVLCLTFELRLTEARMFVQLLSNDYTTIEALRTAASPDKKITLDSTRVFLCSLRARLKIHNIEITTVYGVGYGLDTNSRANIRKAIARYDAQAMPARRESNQAAAPPD